MRPNRGQLADVVLLEAGNMCQLCHAAVAAATPRTTAVAYRRLGGCSYQPAAGAAMVHPFNQSDYVVRKPLSKIV